MADPGVIPGPVYIPNCVAVRLHWELMNDKIVYNVLHARYTTTPTLDQTFVNNLHTAFTSALATSGLGAHLDTETTLLHTGVRDMRQDTQTQAGFSEWVSNNVGGSGSAVGGGPLPPQIALVVSLKTGFSGPANRGRVYIPGWNSTADDGNGLATSAASQDAVDFITAVRAALTAQQLTMTIAHPARAAYTSPKPPNTAHPARPASAGPTVTGISVLNNIWDTQRLRSI